MADQSDIIPFCVVPLHVAAHVTIFIIERTLFFCVKHNFGTTTAKTANNFSCFESFRPRAVHTTNFMCVYVRACVRVYLRQGQQVGQRQHHVPGKGIVGQLQQH